MKLISPLIFLVIFTLPSFSFSSEIQFFNTEMFGQPTSVQKSLMESSKKDHLDLIFPKVIQIDVDDGIYCAASIYYDADKISFDELVENIQRKYPNSKVESLSSNSSVWWRIEDRKFVISLSSNKEEGMFRVIYIKFMSTEKVLKNIIDSLETIHSNCNKK